MTLLPLISVGIFLAGFGNVKSERDRLIFFFVSSLLASVLETVDGNWLELERRL